MVSNSRGGKLLICVGCRLIIKNNLQINFLYKDPMQNDVLTH
jgi:hypothetical protein